MISGLAKLNTESIDDARAHLTRCCGSKRWVDLMLKERPFQSEDELSQKASKIWLSLAEADWREAFEHHPKIGDKEALRQKFAETAAWATHEQGGVAGASDAVLEALAAGNDTYEQKFGYIFIVCATGKTAEEMLNLLQARLPNTPEREIHVAAEEQNKITRIRLEKLLGV